MKKFIKNLLAVALVGAMLGSFGCKDYDEDIKSLNDRVDKVEASVADLQAKIDAGAVITGVTNNADGVVVTLSDGQSFTLKHGTNGKDGQPGQPGKDGKDADVWTIGDDGFWYKNGTKTEYKALGIKGDKGDKGDDGKYYFPGEDGLWDIYENGQKVEDTNISWVGKGLTAVYSNGTVTLSGVEGAEGTVTIKSGAQLGSVAFVPNTVVGSLGYPTTDEPWLVLPAYLDDSRTDNDWKQPWDKSNVVKTVYRLNPTDAYVGGAKYAFINRDIHVLRGVEGDKVTLLNEEGVALKDAGQVDVNATFNYTAYNGRADVNFAALQVWAGQNPVTSDYIATFYEDVYPCIIHPAHDQVPAHHGYYQRTASLKAGEDHGFLIDFVGEVGDAQYPAHFYYSYNDENALDLMPEVLLYECDRDKSFADLGFTGISYKFSLPKEYLADDDDNTNQQAFINVTADGKVTINKNGAWVNKETGSLEPAEGRTPVVRVDAYMTPNKKNGKAGEAQVVASAYIKIEITAKAMPVEPKDPMPDNVVSIDEDNAFDYRKLSAAYTEVGHMTWERVNSEIYGSVAMNAVSFWEKYGGQNDVFDVKVWVDVNNDREIDPNTDKPYSTFTGLATNATHVLADDGIEVTVNLNNVGTQTSFVKVSTNNLVKTQHTYGGDAANYIVMVEIASENVFEYGNFVLTQNFSVADSCPDYKYNERSYLSDAEKLAAQFAGNKTFAEAIVAAHTATGIKDAILVKGDIVGDSWVVRALASETFDVTTNDDTIFDYYGTMANVDDVVFAWYDATVKYNAGTAGQVDHWAEATATPAGGNVDMVEPVSAKSAANDGDFYYEVVKTMYKNFFIKTMNLTQKLVNGEDCGQTYNVVFVNPFYGELVDTTPVKIFGNTPGDQIVNVCDKVVIKEIYNNSTIATWSGAQFVVADNIFAVATGDVVYTKFEWIMSKGDNQAFADAEENAFTEKLVLSDANETNPGNIKWNNYDTALSQAYNLVVTATVAVEPTWKTVGQVNYPLQVVTVDIPVYLAAERK